MEFLTQQNLVRVPSERVETLMLTIKSIVSCKQVLARTFLSLSGKLSAAADFVFLGRFHLRPLQMCLLSAWKPDILPLDDPISINGMIQFHLLRWMVVWKPPVTCENPLDGHVKTARKKLKDLLPVLFSRHLSFKTRGHVYSSCVRCAKLHASETWPLTKPNLQRLQRNNRAMIRQICNVMPQDIVTTRSNELIVRPGIEDLDLILKERRLWWYGHVECSSGAIKTAFDIQVDGKHGPGRPKMTWKQLTERDCREWKLLAINPHDRSTWRSGVRSAMLSASQLSGRGPTDVDVAPVPAR